MRSLLVFLLLGTLTRADGDSVCAFTCHPRSEGSGFEPGREYVYEYRGRVSSEGEAGHQSTMSLRATVTITAATHCDLRLEVDELEVEEASRVEGEWFQEAVTQHHLYFSYQNGRVDAVCPHREEAPQATNLKRGILSALQVSLPSLNTTSEVYIQENDVSGECETRYSVMREEEGRRVVVEKVKEDCLTDLVIPHLPHTSLHPDPYSTQPPPQLPFVRRNQTCRLEKSGKRWERVECREEVQVEGPFSPEATTVTVTSSLVLRELPRPFSGAFHVGERQLRRGHLRMELEAEDLDPSQSTYRSSSDTLAQIADTIELLSAWAGEEAGSDSEATMQPQRFSHLVSLMSTLQRDEDMLDVWNTYSQQDGYRELVMDAVKACESGPCVKVMSSLAAEDHHALPRSALRSWLTSLHFHTHVHPEAVSYIMDVARERKDIERDALMAASSLVYRLCQNHPRTCHQHARPFLEYSKTVVGDSCGWGESRNRQSEVELILRALGNAGLLPSPHLPQTCFLNKMLKRDLRVAALHTNRRSGCISSKPAWTVLEDESEEVEVRVAAFQALLRCAHQDPTFFKRIRTLLLEEKVNQVGSYIYTHLVNLVGSPGQGGLELAGLAAGATVGLHDMFNTNTFRSSRAYKKAHFSSILGMGGSADGNVIFTPDSYLPRHASLNFTLDLPLKSFNLLEFGGDFKGLEDHLEKLFGEGGSLETAEIETVLKSLRPKRAVSEGNIDALQTLYDEARTKNEVEEENPSVSLYMRVLGNELVYTDNVLDSNPVTFLYRLAQDLVSPKSFQVMNQEVVSPTILGFPLRLKINATGLLNFTQENNFQAFSPGQGVTMEGHLSPSAVVTVDQTLMVDGYGSRSGIRRTTTHGASSDFGGKVTVAAGRLVDVELRLPNNNVANMRSAVTLHVYSNAQQGWVDQLSDGPTDGQGDCTPQAVSSIVGLKLCTTMSQKNRYVDGKISPLGSYQRSTTIFKADTFDKFVFRLEKTATQVKSLFDTPDSTRNRKISFEMSREPGAVSGTLVFPGTKMGMQYQWSDTLKNFSLRQIDDGGLRGELVASLESAADGSTGVRYLPSFHVKAGDTVYIEVDGSLAVSDTSFGLNGSLASPLLPGPTSLEASWKRESVTRTHSASARLISGSAGSQGRLEVSVAGSLVMEPQEMALRVDGEYSTDPRHPPNFLSLNLNATKKRMEEGGGLLGSFAFQSSQLESSAQIDYQQQLGHLAVNSNITIQGKEATSHLVLKNLNDEERQDLEVSVGFSSPPLDMDYLARVLYKVSDNAFQAEYEVKGGESFLSKASLTYLAERDPLHLLGGLQLQLNHHILQVGYNLDRSRPGHTLAMVSGVAGGAGGGLQLEADLAPGRPQNISVEMTGGYLSHQAALHFHHTSDPQWENFSGSTKLRWFNHSYTARHNLTWMDQEKHLRLSYEDLTLTTMLKTSPGQQIMMEVFRGDPGTTDPVFKAGMEKAGGVGGEDSYKMYLILGPHTLFQVDVTHKSSERFSGHMRLLESSLEVMGELVELGLGQVKGSGQVSFNLPSGTSHISRLTLTSSYDGVTRNVKLTHQLDEGELTVIEAKLHRRDGWLGDDTLGMALAFSSPVPGLRNLSFAFEFNSDSTRLSYVEAEWEQFKVRGEAVLGGEEGVEVKLVVGDGGECESLLHLYHKHHPASPHHSYSTGATLILGASQPWSLEITSKPGDFRRSHHTSLDISAELQTPLLNQPFKVSWMHNLTEESVDVKAMAGIVRLSSLSFSGVNSLEGDTRRLMGLLEFETPWTGPVFLNASNTHDSASYNATLDFRSSLEPVNTVLADFSAFYPTTSHTTAHFTLTHDQLQVRMNLDNKLGEKSLIHKFEGSANAHRVNSNLEYGWDQYYTPTKLDGRAVIMTSLLPETLDTTVSLSRQLSHYQFQLLGSYGDQTLRADHHIEITSALEWTSILTIVLPNQEKSLSGEVSLKASPDLSSIEIKFSSESGFFENMEFTLHLKDLMTNVILNMEYGGTSVLQGSLITTGSLSLYQADIVLDLSSSYFSNWRMRWEHDLNSHYLVLVEATNESESSGSSEGVHMKAGIDGLFSPEFKHLQVEFDLGIPNSLIDFNMKSNINSSGELEVKFNEYHFHLTSSVYSGEIFSAEIGLPEVEYEARMGYERGNTTIPNLMLSFAQDGYDILILKSECSGLFPIFDVVWTVNILLDGNSDAVMKQGQLQVNVDMSNLQDWAFKGMVKMESDFEGFEHHHARVDFDLTTNTGQITWKLDGEVDINKWFYSGSIHGLLNVYREFSFEYAKKYSLSHRDDVVDRKELYIQFSHRDDFTFQGNVTVIPDPSSSQWSIFLNFTSSEKDVTVYVIPGNWKKYELHGIVRGSTLTIDSKITSHEANDAPFKILQGDVNWSRKKRKRFITTKFTSDISALREVEGQIVIQQRRRLMVNANFKVNNAELKTDISYIPQGLSNPGKISVKIKNDVYWPFETDTTINFSLSSRGVESDLVIDFNGEKAWITSNVKGSLSESYLILKTPFEGFENINVTADILTSGVLGLKLKAELPNVCVTFDGSLDRSYENAFLYLGVHKGCNGQELFRVNFRYKVEGSSLETSAECHMEDFWKLYGFNTAKDSNDDFQGTTQVPQDTTLFSLGVQFSVGVALFSSSRNNSVLMRVYDPENSINHFLLQSYIYGNAAWELGFEFSEGLKFSLQVHKNYESDSFELKVNAVVYHALYLSKPIDGTLTVQGEINEEGGKLEIFANTSITYFPQAHFLASYDIGDDKKGTFKVTSPLGDAEGSLLMQEMENSFSVTADMTSSLHNFKDYYLKFQHELRDGYHSFEILTMQDNFEYQLKATSHDEGDITIVNINLLTPYEKYESYDVILGYPQSQGIFSPYKMHFTGMFGGQVYQFEANHDHSPMWQMQTTALAVSIPENRFGNASASVSFDVSKDAHFHIALPHGDLMLGGRWEDGNVNTSLSMNVPQLGDLVLLANFSLGRSQDTDLKCEYRRAGQAFIGQFVLGRDFKHGNVNIQVISLKEEQHNSVYSLSYKLSDALTLRGQYKDWEVTAVLALTGNTYRISSGNVRVSTNIPKYNIMEGSWNFGRTGPVYAAEVNLDAKESGNMSFKALLDRKPIRSDRAWEKVKVEVLLDSSFTRTHHLQAVFDKSTYNFSASYQYGHETFFIRCFPELKQKAGSISLIWNIPLRGVSTLAFDLSYRLGEMNEFMLKMSVEESKLNGSVAVEPNGRLCTATVSFTSPFTRPFNASLKWTLTRTSLVFQSNFLYGKKYQGNATIKVTNTNSNKELDLQIKLPTEYLHKLLLMVKIDLQKYILAADATVNNHSVKINYKISNNSNIHECLIEGNIYDYKSFYFRSDASLSHLKVNLRYGDESILNAEVDMSHILINFSWEENFLQLNSQVSEIENGYKVMFSLKNSKLAPVMLDLDYTWVEGHMANVHLIIGEAEYNVSAQGNINTRRSSLDIHLESSEDPYVPIDFKAMYDIKNFLKGRMSDMETLATVTLDWGGEFKVDVTGMRNRNILKMAVEMMTPLRFLPRLSFGYSGDLIMRRSRMNFNFSSFIEWSQRMSLEGTVKVNQDMALVNLDLTTPFPVLEMVSFTFQPDHVEASLVMNGDEWDILYDYKQNPFSVAISATTPIEGFENLAFSVSGSVEDGVFLTEAELSWTDISSLKVKVKAEMWNLDVEVSSPWTPMEGVVFHASLRTESEQLTCRATLQLNERKADIRLTYSPRQAELVGRYDEHGIEVGILKLGYSFNNQEMEAEVELRTPYDSLKSLEALFNLGSREHEFLIEAQMYNQTNIAEGLFSAGGGKFRLHLPTLNGFMWTLEAKNKWLELDSQTDFAYSPIQAPVSISFNYQVKAEEEEMIASVSSTSPDLWLESMSCDITVIYSSQLEFYDVSSIVTTKVRDETPKQHELAITVGTSDDLVSINSEIEGDYLSLPYEITAKVPMFNFFIRDGILELGVSRNQEHQYKFSYENTILDADSSRRMLTVSWYDWMAVSKVFLNKTSLEASFSHPNELTKHSLVLEWSEDFSLEQFSVKVKINSPLLEEEGLRFNLNFQTQRRFTFILDTQTSYGPKNILGVEGSVQYSQRQQQVRSNVQITSDLFGTHSVESSIQWKGDIRCNIKVKNGEGEMQHTLTLHVSTSDYTVQLTCDSPWLPYHNIVARGKVNTDVSLDNIQLEGEMTGDSDLGNISIEGILKARGLMNVSGNITVKQSDNMILKSTLEVESTLNGFKANAMFRSNHPSWKSDFRLTLESNRNYRSLRADLYNFSYLESISFYNSKRWSDDQEFEIRYGDNKFSVESKFGKESGGFQLYSVYDYSKVFTDFKYRLDNEKNDIKFLLKTPLDALQVLRVQLSFPKEFDASDGDERYELVRIYFQGTEDQKVKLQVVCYPDPVMKWSVWANLETPLQGYQKFEVLTPQFTHGANIFSTFLAYPGGKVGVVLRSEGHAINRDMQFSIYLPYEEYKVISLKYISGRVWGGDRAFTVEARVGKLGITFAFIDKRLDNLLELVIEVNQYQLTLSFNVMNELKDHYKVMADILVRLPYGEPIVIDFDFEYHPRQRYLLALKVDSETVFMLGWDWREGNELDIIIPNLYAFEIRTKLKSTHDASVCMFNLGLPDWWARATAARPTYYFEANHTLLDYGNYFSVNFRVTEPQEHSFHFESLHYLSPTCLKEDLVAAAGSYEIGFRTLMQKDPGILTTKYDTDIQLLFPAGNTLHLNATALSGGREFDAVSTFQWGDTVNYRPHQPMVLQVILSDHSMFGKEEYSMKAEFKHPEIESIILQGNLSQSFSSPLHAVAELIDDNSPGMNVMMTVDVPLTSTDREQQVKVNISQPSSGFGLLINNLMKQQVDVENTQDKKVTSHHNIQYWSLSQEKWQQMNISTGFDVAIDGYRLMADVVTSESNWGYMWEGYILNQVGISSLGVKGTSMELGDFWQFDTQVNKVVPEIKLSLQTDHEARRVRVGLHSPVAAGAILEHRKFGRRWNLDAGVGVTLTSPDVMQYHVEVDPSLDLMHQDTWARITSPAANIFTRWQRSLRITANETVQWFSAELPTAFSLLVNTQTLHRIWRSEKANLENFIRQLNRSLQEFSVDFTRNYVEPLQSLLLPAWDMISSSYHHYVARMVEGVVGSVANLHDHLAHFLSLVWRQAGQVLDNAVYQLQTWWSKVHQGASEKWQLVLYEGARVVNSALRFTTNILDTIWTSWTTAYFNHLHPVLVRYSAEVKRVFLSKCWANLHTLLTDVKTEVYQRWQTGMQVMQEFLQLDRYTAIITDAAQAIGERMRVAGLVFQDGMEQLWEAVQEWDVLVSVKRLYQDLQNATWSLPALIAKGYITLEANLLELLPSREAVTQFWQEVSQEVQSIAGESVILDYLNAAAGNVYDLSVMQWQEWSEEGWLDLWTAERVYEALDEMSTILFGVDPQLSKESLEVEVQTRGQVLYTQHLPVPWPTFLHSPQWHLLARTFQQESALSEAGHLLNGELDTLASGWEALRLPSALHPPFAATATIMGSHITTFDLHHYHFLGPCSYLLARDFVGGTFSLVGVYQMEENTGRAGLASVRIITPGATNVTLHVNGSVDTTEVGNAEIYRGSDHAGVRVGGVVVVCGRASRGCTFTLSGSYFGKVKGLLGRYNNERSDDCRGPDSSGPLTAAQLATAWAVSTTPCYHANQVTARRNISFEPEEVVERCLTMFLRKNSPLSPCHAFVNPKPYFYHCVSQQTWLYTEDQSNNEERLVRNSSCHAAMAYQTQCRVAGVTISFPHMCRQRVREHKLLTVAAPPVSSSSAATSSAVLTGSCTLPGGGSVPSGWSKIYRGGASESRESGETDGSADVALVLEMANCNKGKDFQFLLRLLKVQIRRAGSEDVRYSVIKYRGDTVEPASPFMSDEALMPLLAALNPEGGKSDQGGAQAVIAAARDLPWRVGVSRTIVHIGCRTCDEGDAVYQALQGNHATYHLITKFRPIMVAPTPKKAATMAAKLLGFDRTFVYTVRDLRKFQGNDKLRSALEEPVGSCVVAAQASGGSVFNMNKWIPNKDVLTKKFVRVLSQRVSQSTVAPECQRCQCIGGATEMKLKCRSCSLSFEGSRAEEAGQVPAVPHQETNSELRLSSSPSTNTQVNMTSIKADIKQDFLEQFVSNNAAFALQEEAEEQSDESSSSSESDSGDEEDMEMEVQDAEEEVEEEFQRAEEEEEIQNIEEEEGRREEEYEEVIYGEDNYYDYGDEEYK